MLDLDNRSAILQLRLRGYGAKGIARILGVSRSAVRRVLRQGQAEVPRLQRDERLARYLDRVRDLYVLCKGNLVRVHELLADEGVEVAYQTLTAFCRRHEIGTSPKEPSGHYEFAPGQEMQHDTSPHRVEIAGQQRVMHCASLVLAYSRTLYAQLYARFSRLTCKAFLSEALQYFGGSAGRCIIDNSSVVLAGGSGATARVAPEMQAFCERFGFRFVAHEVGDANRSARVERPFHFIENNFYPGRTFASLSDLNAELRAWCEVKNRSLKKHLRIRPIELLAVEQPHLRPLPPYIPEVYEVHVRRVDVDGYVCLHSNRYSMPVAYLGRQVQVRESLARVRIFDGHRLLAEHARQEPGANLRLTLPEHREPRRWHARQRPVPPQEQALRGAAPQLGLLLDALRRVHGGRVARAVQQLHRIWVEYPTEAVLDAVRTALAYGLTDLGRIERMVLRRIAGDFFRLPLHEPAAEPLEEPDEEQGPQDDEPDPGGSVIDETDDGTDGGDDDA